MSSICFFRFLLIKSCVGYLHFQFSVFLYYGEKFLFVHLRCPCCIFIVTLISLPISRRLIFAGKYSPFDFCQPSTKNQLTLVTIEHNLKILEAPQSYQEKNFDEEKIKLIDFRTALASHRQLVWLIPTRKNPECSRDTIKSFNKYFGTGKSACLLCLIYLASFLMFLAFLYCIEFFNGI